MKADNDNDVARESEVTAYRRFGVPLKDRLSLSPADASALTGIGITSIKNATYSGALVARKFGKNTVILPNDLRAWIEALPLIDKNTTNENAA